MLAPLTLTSIFYLFLVACLLQAFTNFLEYRRTRLYSKLYAGTLGFILLSLSFAFVIISFGFNAEMSRRAASFVYRSCAVLGILLWVIDQVSWWRSRYKLV